MQMSQSIKELATALSSAQAEMPAVQMNATNPFLKNKYADLGAVIQTSRPILAKHGLAVSQTTYSEGDEVGVTTMLVHKSGEWISNQLGMRLDDERGKSRAQVAGSIITYLRRYSLASILGMYADEDADGHTSTTQAAQQYQTQAVSKPAPYPVAEPNSSDIHDTEQEPADALRYMPEKLREYINKLALQYSTQECNDNQKKLMAAMLGACFDGDDGDRQAVQYYLTGKQHMGDMTNGEIRALLKWLEPAKDANGKYYPNHMSVREANAALSVAFKDAGQAALI